MKELIKRIITDQDQTWAGALLKPVLAFLSIIYAGTVSFIHWLYHQRAPELVRHDDPGDVPGALAAGQRDAPGRPDARLHGLNGRRGPGKR